MLLIPIILLRKRNQMIIVRVWAIYHHHNNHHLLIINKPYINLIWRGSKVQLQLLQWRLVLLLPLKYHQIWSLVLLWVVVLILPGNQVHHVVVVLHHQLLENIKQKIKITSKKRLNHHQLLLQVNKKIRKVGNHQQLILYKRNRMQLAAVYINPVIWVVPQPLGRVESVINHQQCQLKILVIKTSNKKQQVIIKLKITNWITGKMMVVITMLMVMIKISYLAKKKSRVNMMIMTSMMKTLVNSINNKLIKMLIQWIIMCLMKMKMKLINNSKETLIMMVITVVRIMSRNLKYQTY